jgi:RNA polymerase sigma factor (sigma-70 family)
MRVRLCRDGLACVRLRIAGRPVTDEDTGSLVTAAAAGDKAAWQALVERFSGLVWSIARAHRLSRADAADVSQTTWLRLAENIHKINNPERVGAWLATAARRECLQCIRQSSRSVPTDDMALFDDTGTGDNPTEAEVLRAEAEREEAVRSKQLWRALGRLPVRCQQLLRILMASPPPSYAEVAVALGLPVGGIGPTRARCLQRLRQELGNVSGTG